jgi:hypothetical protein
MQTNQNSLFNLSLASSRKHNCKYCDKTVSIANSTKHEKSCNKNPKNFRECPVCKKLHSKKGVTCSYSCSNTLFRTGNKNGNWKIDSYQSTCFFHHGKKCLVCGEDKIVAAHHVNGNHNDNRPENLVPLCPTHHQYVHSKYVNEVQPIIENYITDYLRMV